MGFGDRARADACPGVFAPHDAADGALARVRLPGGALSCAQAVALADCAAELGDGSVHLTSRGNVQLRGLDRDGLLVPRLRVVGLLPSMTHERVRNIVASPASGLCGGLVDVRPLVSRLDSELCARPELAGLPGRFQFALDDGRGDVFGDVGWRAVAADSGALLLSGVDTGVRIPLGGAVSALLSAAEAFLLVRGSAWRMGELADVTPIVAAVGEPAVRPVAMPVRSGFPLDEFTVDGGGFGICVAPVLGALEADTLQELASRADRMVVTPWRTLLLPGVRRADLTGLAGLFTEAVPGSGVSACAGLGCAKSLADVRADARHAMPVTPAGLRVHVSGCERRCGRPESSHVDVLATGDGYLMDGTPVTSLSNALAGKEKP